MRKSRMFSDIIDFHEKHGLSMAEIPKLLPQELQDFRYKFLVEEVEEFENAHYAGDLVKAADALADLVYVALGTAYMMGLPFNDVWDLVHHANMKKQRATRAEESKRGSRFDVIKPPGWKAPDEDIRFLLREHGADV